MFNSKKFQALLLALTASACGADIQGSYDNVQEEPVSESTEPLIGGTAGTKTGLVARFNFPQTNSMCSGVLVPTGSTAQWFITAAHCIDSEPYNASEAFISLQNGTRVGIDAIYPHPQGEWGLTGSDLGDGDTDGTGRVDVVLVHLSSSVAIAAADRRMFFSTDNAAINTYEESVKDDGANTYSWLAASISPSAKWPTRADNSANTEGGDSGGPIWSRASIDGGGRLYQGLLSSGNAGGVTDSSSFYAWALDGIECGVFDLANPKAAFCSPGCPCGVGEGDCDSNAECKAGLTCQSNAGPKVGLPSSYDICLEPRREGRNTEGYCESIGGCQIFEGDCNSHAGCKDNLICRRDVGAAVGLDPSVDVCDLPRVAGWRGVNRSMGGGRATEASGYCTPSSPCGLGEGDCDERDDSTCRGTLRCKANVGNQFGFSNNTVDVCVHPDYF